MFVAPQPKKEDYQNTRPAELHVSRIQSSESSRQAGEAGVRQPPFGPPVRRFSFCRCKMPQSLDRSVSLGTSEKMLGLPDAEIRPRTSIPLSVVLPNFNDGKLITRALRALAGTIGFRPRRLLWSMMDRPMIA